jgi:hypothetical protein
MGTELLGGGPDEVGERCQPYGGNEKRGHVAEDEVGKCGKCHECGRHCELDPVAPIHSGEPNRGLLKRGTRHPAAMSTLLETGSFHSEGATFLRRIVLLLMLVLAAVLASTASASQLIDRNPAGVKLAVNAKGEALITYKDGGQIKHVLAWGAVNAIAPTRTRKQVAFKLDYAGGWGRYHSRYFQTFGSACGAYDGPALAWKVTACKAPDGSYWALQSWQRMLPNYGLAPNATSSVWELRLSHWTGDLPVLTVSTDWAWHQWDHLYGNFTYGDSPVFGFRATPGGNPLDTFGRNIYVDTFNSSYGPGWQRENSFLAHTNTGVFCYSFNPHASHPSGKGTKYRATVEGPGVTPDVMWEGVAPGTYDKDLDLQANAAIAELGDAQCKPN